MLLHRAIRKYGRFDFSIIAIGAFRSLSEASEAEISAIIENNSIDPFGYNLSKGGMGTPGVRKPHSDITKAKISAGNKGREHSKETLEKMSAAKRGKPLSDEHKKNLSSARKGRSPTLEQRQKQAESVRGRKFPLRSIANLETILRGGNSATGIRGVTQDGKKFIARIGVGNKRMHLGVFDTPEAAEAAYLRAVEDRIAELRTMI